MSRLSCLAVVLVLLATAAMAFPFGANSGVTELNPKNLAGFMNTHKPVFIVFYAPWCGHCKSIHPEWEKFAKGVKDVVRVGAINADQHKELGSQFGIQGFPTIKYWKMGNKKGMKPLDYQQARSAGALQNAAVAEIHNKGVVTVADEAAITAALGKASSGKAVILFTAKNKSPPILSVLSQSPHFLSKVAFLLAPSSSKKLAEALSVVKLPTVLTITADSSVDRGFTFEMYTGSVDYTSIAKHLQGILGVSATEEGDSQAKKENAVPPTTEEAKPKAEPSKPKAAAPVRPVPLVPAKFAAYCGQGSQKIRSQQPLCVVSFASGISLDDLHAKFGNEPFLFFDASSASEHTRAEFTRQLNLDSPITVGDAVLVRAFKATAVKYHVVTGVTNDALEAALLKAVGGELSMNKGETFLALTDDE